MIKENLIKLLKKYLEDNNVKYYPDSLDYKSERKDVPQVDGTLLDLYAVSYTASINDRQYDSDATYFAYFEPSTEKLLYIIGPQSYEKSN
jgi:hypothetical protein